MSVKKIAFTALITVCMSLGLTGMATATPSATADCWRGTVAIKFPATFHVTIGENWGMRTYTFQLSSAAYRNTPYGAQFLKCNGRQPVRV